MSQVAAASSQPDPQKITQHTQVIISSQCQILAAKVQMLCNIAAQCQPPGPEFFPDGEGWKEVNKGKYTNEAAAATENTYCATMERLQKLLEDDSNWGVISTDQLLADQLKDVNEANLDSAKFRAYRESEHSRPCYLLGCLLTKMEDGVWECRLKGNLHLFALGDSPATAMDNFDKLYHGKKN